MTLQRVRKTVHETVSAPQAQCTDRAGGGSSRDTKLGSHLLESSDESAGGLQAQFIDSVVDKVVDMPDGVQRQGTMDTGSARNRGGSAVAGHWRIEIHVLAQRQIPMVQTMQKTQTDSTVATQ